MEHIYTLWETENTDQEFFFSSFLTEEITGSSSGSMYFQHQYFHQREELDPWHKNNTESVE